MKDTTVAAILGGLLVLAVLTARRRKPLQAQPRQPGLPRVVSAMASAPAALPIPRGIPANLAEAIRRAPIRPSPGADRADDAPVLTLSEETARTLAAAAVARVPGLVLTSVDNATSMRSGVRRVLFTAHEPTAPLSLRLVATFEKSTEWDLVWLRPASAVPDVLDPLAGADFAADTYACFRPVVTPGAC